MASAIDGFSATHMTMSIALLACCGALRAGYRGVK